MVRFVRAGAVFVVTGVMYLGFPLLGWGLDDLPGLFADWARVGYAMAVFALAAGVVWQTRRGMQGIRGGRGEPGKLVRKQTVVRYGMTVLLFGALTFLAFADRRSLAVMPLSGGVRWIGTGLAAVPGSAWCSGRGRRSGVSTVRG